MKFLNLLKKLRKLFVRNPGWAAAEIEFIRKAEFYHSVSSPFFHKKDILEIGGSNGYLASLISSASPSSLVSIDCSPVEPFYFPVLHSSAFIGRQTLQFNDSQFDVIFSSNTFEHIKDLELLFGECARVLRRNGVVILFLPSHVWVIAGIFNQLINLVPFLPHGEHSATAFDEAIRFHPIYWKKKFKQYGFICDSISSCGFFYAEPRLFPLCEQTKHLRKVLANLLGPSSYMYIIRPID